MKKKEIILSFALLLVVTFWLGSDMKEITNMKATLIKGLTSEYLVKGTTDKYKKTEGLEGEDINMYLIYQLARRSVVEIEVKNSVASGLIWKINDDSMIIASNRHLLMKDVKAKVSFCNNESTEAEIIGYSQQYDIGFLKLDIKDIPKKAIREIYEVVPLIYNLEDNYDAESFRKDFCDKEVLHIGAVSDENSANVYAGIIKSVGFVPVFNTHVIISEGYSRAGMSGGGIFDRNGILLGMVSGGDVSDASEVKEAEITYSIPAELIERELTLILDR